MQKLFSIFLAIGIIFSLIVPAADASIRMRKGRTNTPVYNNQYTPYYPVQPVYQAPFYQATQVYPTSGGSTYYYSQNYVAGYTYYSTPNPGYYYYFATTPTNNYTYYNNTPTYPYNNSNMICTIINSRYQCVANTYGANYATYPGCSSPDSDPAYNPSASRPPH